MDKIILNSSNLSSSLRRSEPTYYVIEDVISIFNDIKFPAGSVLDFMGGSFEAATIAPRKLDLNGSTVCAPAYGIFDKNINVVGFANSYIKSEWFKYGNSSEHEAIHRSLEAADGIPVHLESRTYELTHSIKFPACTSNQTLVSPGTLRISSDIAAIIVDKEHITLDINRITCVQPSDNTEETGPNPEEGLNSETKARIGTGILLTGNAYYVNINVHILTQLCRGIAVIPDISTSGTGYSSVQYCTIRFKNIHYTDYCFYVDIFTHSSFSETNGVSLNTWFTETRVIGGRMEGINGIYFVNPDADDPDKPYAKFSESINGLLFENIGFEGLTGKPLVISHVGFSQFLYLRMAESLPGLGDQWNQNEKWIFLNNVTNLTFSLKGLLDPMRIHPGDNVRSVIFDAFIVDEFGWVTTHLDRLVILPLYDKASGTYGPKIVASSSIQPYNMTKTIVSDDPPEYGFDPKLLTIDDLLPLNDTSYPPVDNDSTDIVVRDTTVSRISRFNVLPRTLNVIIKENQSIVIDLTGLSRFAPCIIDVNSVIKLGGSLVFKTRENPLYITVVENGKEQTYKSVSYNGWGLYRLNFDSKWNVVITTATF